MTILGAAFFVAFVAFSVIAASAGGVSTEPSDSSVAAVVPADPLGITDSISREFSVFVGQPTDVTDAVSREFTVFDDSAANATDAVSREFTVFNDLVNPVELTDAVSRELSAFVVIPIELGVPYEGTLAVGSQVYFRLDTPPDVTVRINLDHASGTAWTELYASFGSPPNDATAEFVFSNPSEPDQELVIPNSLAGSYFILVRMTAESDPAAPSGVTLLAAGVPFGVDGVQPPTVGAGEEVTLRVTGGHLDTAASIYLRHADSGTEIAPVRTEVLDAAHARLRFNLLGAELGSYDVISEPPEGDPVVLLDDVILEAPDDIAVEQEVIPSPALARRHGAIQGTTTIILRNETNVDVPFILLDVYTLGNPDLTLTLEGVDPTQFEHGETYERGQFVIESLAPDVELILPVRIDLDRGYRESSVRIYVEPLALTRRQVRDGYLLGEGQWFDTLVNSYRESHETSADFEEWVPVLREAIGLAFDQHGLSGLPGSTASNSISDAHELLCLAECNLPDLACTLCFLLPPPADVVCFIGCAASVGSFAGYCSWCCSHPDSQLCGDQCPSEPYDEQVCMECDDPDGVKCCCPRHCDWAIRPICDGCTDLACIWTCADAACTCYNCSSDPNEKAGPLGFAEERFLSPAVPMTYRLYFENMETATAPAGEVTITDVLDESLSLTSFRVRQFHFGATTIDVPEGRSSFDTVIDMVGEIGLLVRLEAGVNLAAREATFSLRALDPETMQVPAELDRGFLPPNDDTGRGEGYVEFTIKPYASTPTGTVVTNTASIVFDYNDPIETNEVFNTIDSGAPDTSVQALSAESMTPFVLRWSGADDEGGSGLAQYRIYVRTDGGPAELWYSGTDTWAHFDGQVGSSYAFYSIGADNVDNVESLPITLDATTTVTAPRRPGDIDRDGDTDLDDLAALVTCLDSPIGPAVEVPSSCADADVNGDRQVDIQDFAVLQAGFGSP